MFAKFDRESGLILRAFSEPPTTRDGTPCAPTHELARESATVQLQDRWGNFCRSLVLASAVGRIRTSSGVVIPKTRPSLHVALLDLRASFAGRDGKPPYWEPKWFDPAESIDAAQRLGISNYATVSAALGSTPSPLDDLRTIRNFFAHRGELAGRTMRTALMLASGEAAHSYLTEIRIGGASRFEAWVRTLRRMARASIR